MHPILDGYIMMLIYSIVKTRWDEQYKTVSDEQFVLQME